MNKNKLTDINIRLVNDEKNITKALLTYVYSNGYAYIESHSFEKTYSLHPTNNDVWLYLTMYSTGINSHKPLFLEDEKKKKMTIEEIEKKLGFGIEIVSNK